MGLGFIRLQVRNLWSVSVIIPWDSWPCKAIFLCRTHAALKDRLPALWVCGLIKTPQQDDWQLFYSPPVPIPIFFPLRFEESALQASRRCAEKCQETLWWSEPAAGEQRRSGHVTREQRMWRWRGCGREEEIVKDDKWKMTSVATIEMSMYIYYIKNTRYSMSVV